MCHVINVSARGLRAFRSRPASRRQRSDLVAVAHIKEQSRLSLGSYGRPRMTEELKGIGLNLGHRRVGRFLLGDVKPPARQRMRENKMSVIRTRKHKATTDSSHKFNIAPNLLDRNFAAPLVHVNIHCWAVDVAGDLTGVFVVFARDGADVGVGAAFCFGRACLTRPF